MISEFQLTAGRGLGGVLLERLATRATEVGVTAFSASLLTDNRAMLALFARLGRMEVRHDSGSAARLTVRLDIARPGALHDALRAAASRRGRAVTEAFFATPDEFRAWLGEHGTTARRGVGPVWRARGPGSRRSTRVPGRRVRAVLRLDRRQAHQGPGPGGYFRQRFTPRRARSKWSKINREQVAAL